jgi:hypothetical protein
MAILPAQLQPFVLAGAGASLGDSTLVLSSFNDINGVALSMTSFGAKGYGTIEPNSGSSEEQISFTGITNNANGTVTLTGVKTVLFITPFTETANLAKSHAGGVKFVISNTSAYENQLASVSNNETVTGVWTFSTTPTITNAPVNPTDAANKAYIDGVAIAGAPNASDIVKGITKLTVAPVSPTNPLAVGDNDSRVPTASQTLALVGNNLDVAIGTGNKVVTQTGLIHAAENYALSTGSANAYVVALTPIPISYTAGMVVRFTSNFGNTASATVNVNGLGAKTIKKADGATNLISGDIASGQTITLVYDGTNLVMQNPVANAPATPLLFKNGTTTYNLTTASGNQNIAHGLGVIPKYIRITVLWSDGSASLNHTSESVGSYNGTITSMVWYGATNTGSDSGNSTANIAEITQSNATNQIATVTFDTTNIILAWTKTGSPTGTAYILWEAFA